jgi:hypothetical protein
VAQSEAIEKILKSNKKRFAFRLQRKKRELRDSIREGLEQKLYKENNYINLNGKWVSGKEQLYRELNKFIKSEK